MNIMEDKFDIQTDLSILPMMQENAQRVEQLIDAVNWYVSLLNNGGKKVLTKFVLNMCSTQSTELKLSDYESNNELIADMRKYLLPKKSAKVSSIEMHNSKQKHLNIEDFDIEIENKKINLTLAYSDGKTETSKVLAKSKEKLFIAIFAKGLNDIHIKTIVKARN